MATKKKPTAKKAKKPAASKKVTQPDKLVRMLPASISAICTALGVQTHSARAMISTLRKTRGLTIELIDAKYTLTK